MLAVWSHNGPDDVLKNIAEFLWDQCIMGGGEEHKLDLEEFLDDI